MPLEFENPIEKLKKQYDELGPFYKYFFPAEVGRALTSNQKDLDQFAVCNNVLNNTNFITRWLWSSLSIFSKSPLFQCVQSLDKHNLFDQKNFDKLNVTNNNVVEKDFVNTSEPKAINLLDELKKSGLADGISAAENFNALLSCAHLDDVLVIINILKDRGLLNPADRQDNFEKIMNHKQPEDLRTVIEYMKDDLGHIRGGQEKFNTITGLGDQIESIVKGVNLFNQSLKSNTIANINRMMEHIKPPLLIQVMEKCAKNLWTCSSSRQHTNAQKNY